MFHETYSYNVFVYVLTAGNVKLIFNHEIIRSAIPKTNLKCKDKQSDATSS